MGVGCPSIFTFSSWIRSSICFEAASCALNRLMVLVSSGSSIFPSVSLTTRSRSRYLVWKKKPRELTTARAHRGKYCEGMVAAQSPFSPHIMLPQLSCYFQSSSLFFFSPTLSSMEPACCQHALSVVHHLIPASAEAKAFSLPGQRFKVSSPEQNGASQF